jgi:hypothetical protein
VLNGFLQALVGLYDYAEIADDDKARALFRAGDRQARREVPRSDTARGRATARAARSPTSATTARARLPALAVRPHEERPVLLDRRRASPPTCASRPGVRFLPAGRPAKGRAAPVRFFVTKISCVTLRVTRGGRPVATVTRVLGRGARALAWVPPRAGTYASRSRRATWPTTSRRCAAR